MNGQTTTTPNIWALLIGIDCYMGCTIAGLPDYHALEGCVNDITLMGEFLRKGLGVPIARIRKLTASGLGTQPKESKKDLPTKANIVAAFADLAQPDGPQPGDQVYIHYSGHGGRAVTVYPQVKGKDGLDESLVPTDFGQFEHHDKPEDRYLRDVELAALLQTLVDRGLIVTVVLDSCHAGGAARGRGDRKGVRGSAEIDRIPRVPSALVGTPDELAARWKAQTRGTRATSAASGWLPDTDGYTLLAACRALELANEFAAPNGKKHGALSYWLWHTLQSQAASWKMVRQQVVARVHVAYPNQTPQLQGVDRAVFGGAALALPAGVNVLEVQGDRLRLNIGQAGGVNLGAQYFIYRKDATDFKLIEQRQAVVKLDEVMDVESWASVVRRLGDDGAIEPGAQALLFDPGASQQRAVRLVRDDALPDVKNAALASLAAAIEQSESRFVRLAGDGEHAFFQIGVTEEEAYQIRDADGHPFPNVEPVPSIVTEDHANERVLVQQLNHLARYHNVLELKSGDIMSPLSGKLEVTLMRTPEEPFAEPGGDPTVKANDQIYFLRIRNLFDPVKGPPSDDEPYIEERRRRTMNITVLNLAPDWSISRLLPPVGNAEDYYDLEPQETLKPPRTASEQQKLPGLKSSLPPGVEEAIDILKVCATTDTTSFDSWQLPPLADGPRRAESVDFSPPPPGHTWTTTAVSVRVVK
jgi:hypothetical protein